MNKFEDNILDISHNYYKYLMSLENVNGIGLGFKYINNVNTFKPCIHVLVEKKVNDSYLSKNNIIPKSYMGIKTDIIEVGNHQLLSNPGIPEKFRPLEGGISISCISDSGTGTLGCIVRKKKLDYFQYFILTNNHVVAGFNTISIGTPVIQPGYFCGGSFPEDIVGRLKDFVPIKSANETDLNPPENYADAALVKIYNKALISNKFRVIGNLKGSNNAQLGETIVKVGFMTAQTLGRVETLGTTTKIQTLPNKIALFKDQIRAKITVTKGDSGSVAVNNNDEVVGLLFTGYPEKRQAYLNNINTVLNYFNVEIYTK